MENHGKIRLVGNETAFLPGSWAMFVATSLRYIQTEYQLQRDHQMHHNVLGRLDRVWGFPRRLENHLRLNSSEASFGSVQGLRLRCDFPSLLRSEELAAFFSWQNRQLYLLCEPMACPFVHQF